LQIQTKLVKDRSNYT